MSSSFDLITELNYLLKRIKEDKLSHFSIIHEMEQLIQKDREVHYHDFRSY